MNFIGDYFAIGIVIILFMFFFDSKISLRHMPESSRIFIACLALTIFTAATDLLAGYLIEAEHIQLWVNMAVNTMYFMINIVTTTLIALYFFTKLLEHTHERHCMKKARIGLTVLFSVYTVIIIANIWTGWVFYFLPDGTYCRGPLNVMGYIITVAQMVLVIICYIRNVETVNGAMRRALKQIFPAILICIVIQRIYPEIMLNSFIIALVNMVLFLTFQGQRHGVHSLTQLNDRHRFFTEVDYRISQNEPFQIFLINIKNFGTINQKYGHLFGDEVLYQFAFSLEKLLKDSLSFHMNGTVFSVIMRYTYQDVAEKQCGELLDFLEKGVYCSDRQIDIDYVMAHYVANGHETAATELFETIEYSVTKATEKKQRYIRCGYEDSEEVGRRRYLRDRLRTVGREQGYEVWYQPIKCLSTGEFCTMEALIRLREPDGSLVSPGEFIPLAEQTGSISPITWFVLEEVCDTLKNNPEFKDVAVSINMPMSQLLEKGFLPRFTGIVDQAGIDHRHICIEFTERAILENFREILSVMETLTKEGFRFYLDDFGAGYSNFNCLLQLPFRVIKLDTCLVHSGADGLPDYTMVNTITKLCHSMGLTVIAEGAETQEEVRILTEQGVDRIQGYAFARPMPVDALLKFYHENSNES